MKAEFTHEAGKVQLVLTPKNMDEAMLLELWLKFDSNIINIVDVNRGNGDGSAISWVALEAGSDR